MCSHIIEDPKNENFLENPGEMRKRRIPDVDHQRKRFPSSENLLEDLAGNTSDVGQ